MFLYCLWQQVRYNKLSKREGYYETEKAAIAIIALLLTGGASAAIVHLMRAQDTNMQQAANDQAERRDTSDTSSDDERRTDTAERTPTEQTAPTPQRSQEPQDTGTPE